jgi:argininosuccinate lyase
MVLDFKANKARMAAVAGSGFATATDLADWMVQRLNIPFREAHHITGRLVGWCIAEQRTLPSLTLAEFQRFSPVFEADVLQAVTVEASVAARTSEGGTIRYLQTDRRRARRLC